MTQRLRWFRLVLFAALLGVSGLGHAQTASPPGSLTAEQHIEQAQLLFKQQKFSEAGDHLLAAHQQKPQPVLLFNAGQAYRKALRPVEARDAYQKLIDTYPDHALVPESKGYVQTLDALIAQVKEKQQIELALTEQKSKTEKNSPTSAPAASSSNRNSVPTKSPSTRRPGSGCWCLVPR